MIDKFNPAYAGHINAGSPIGVIGASPVLGPLHLNAVPMTSGEIDSALARIDDKISLLGKQALDIAEIANVLCSSAPQIGETSGAFPQPIATGVREKLDERERRLSAILEGMSKNIDRLRAL